MIMVPKVSGLGRYNAIIGNDFPMINGPQKKPRADAELLTKVRVDLNLENLGLFHGLESLALVSEEATHGLSPLSSLDYPPGFEPWNTCEASLRNDPIHRGLENVIESPDNNKCFNGNDEAKSGLSCDEDVAFANIARRCKKKNGKK